MLFTPEQLQRQAPHRGTGARPRQSLYQPTGWLRPSRGITMVLARATGAGGGFGAAGATAGTAFATGAAGTGIGVAAAAAASTCKAASAACSSLARCTNSRWSPASTVAASARWAADAQVIAAGCDVIRGKLTSHTAIPPRRGARQRRKRPAMRRATRARRQGLRRLHDRHGLAICGPEWPHLRILDNAPFTCLALVRLRFQAHPREGRMFKRRRPSWRARFASRFGVPVALLGVVTGVSPLTATVGAHAGTMQNYIVLYSASAVPADASASMAKAGGSLVYSYPQIGVVIAKSDSTTFRDAIVKDSRVEGAAATAAFATQVKNQLATTDDASGPPPGDLPNAPATDSDSLSPLQWDMRQIHTPEAHAITGGSPAVLVGDIDTGIDFNHPDLRQNIDVANSANCLSGAPVPGLAAQDGNGHGTHTAGTIAAAANGQGIVGVAPNVRIAGIKAGNADGFFFPQAVVCAFMWAGTHGFNVTNNSYFADPWYFNCKNDPAQRAIWKAESRAIAFAAQHGVTNVAAMGNFRDDLAHPTRDVISPDDGTPVPRPVHNDCAVVP